VGHWDTKKSDTEVFASGSLTPIASASYPECVLKPNLILLGIVAGVASASCDAPVTRHDPVPAGQIDSVRSALIPVSVLGGPVGGPDPQPIDCTVDGCAVSDNPCFDYVCNTSTLVCQVTYHNGLKCDDGNACTSGDACSQGSCVAGTAITCQAQDQCHSPGTCDPSSGACSNPAKADNSPCNDGNACTSNDSCQGGVCKGGAAACAASDQCHNPGTCDPTTGACSNPVKADNSPCDDQNACTRTDTCQGGACRGGNGVVCAAADQCHDVGQCDTVTGACSSPLKPPGFACDDGVLCTYGDACNASGACAGTHLDCVSDAFADRSCNGSQTCTVVPKPGAACDDHNPCTKGDVQDATGKCAGMSYTCPVTDCMTANACDGNGGCVPAAKPDGTDCDADQNKCTPSDRCKAGVCVRDPSPVTCVPKDCNSAACNPATGNCEYTATSGGSCGVTGCYTKGTCGNGKCSGVPKDCSAQDSVCAQGICDATTGQCMSAPKPNGTSCDPGGKCGSGAMCAFGTCELAAATCAAASGPCKVPACDPASGACTENNRPAGTICDPQASCLGAGICDDSGQCVGAPAPNGEPCTTPEGQIGLCAAGACTARAGGSGADGAADAAAGSDDGGAGGPPDAASDRIANPASGGCCALAAGGAGERGPLGLLALSLFSVLFVVARRRR
jgi:hypothetical protein